MVRLEHGRGYLSIKAVVQPLVLTRRSEEEALRALRDELEAVERTYEGEVLREPLVIRGDLDARWLPDRVPRDVDLVLVLFDSGSKYLLRRLRELGLPAVLWQDRGYAHSWSWDTRGFLSRWGVEAIAPIGPEEHGRVARVASAVRALARTKALVFGRVPAPNVASEWSFEEVERRLGVEVEVVPTGDLLSRMDEVRGENVESVLREWEPLFENFDEERLRDVARLYLAIKGFILERGADAVTINCLEDLMPRRFVTPCIALARLIDEGVVAGCEADVNALLSMLVLSYVAREPCLMGNVYFFRPWPGPGFPPVEERVEDVRRALEENVVRLTHDVVPLSMSEASKWVLRDYHGMGKGATAYAPLPVGREVTLLRLSPDLREAMAVRGRVVRVGDTVHCRLSVWIKVRDARALAEEAYAFHYAMAYGDLTRELALFSRLVGIRLKVL